jgi:hypothetical protein
MSSIEVGSDDSDWIIWDPIFPLSGPENRTQNEKVSEWLDFDFAY